MRLSLFLVLIVGIFSTVLTAAPPAPSVFLREPISSGWAGCSLQNVTIAIQDADGVDETTISLEVDGTVYNWPSPNLAWDGDSMLVFTPSSPFPNNYTVDVILLYVEDADGTPISGPISWNFRMDLDNPYYYIGSRTPAPGTTISNRQPTVSVDVADSTSGIPLGGLCMCFHSNSITCPGNRLSGYCWETSPYISYVDSTFFVNVEGLSFSFQEEDSVTACLRKAVDNVPQEGNLCGPNWIDTFDLDLCWDFVVDAKGPRAVLVYPEEGDTIACDTIVVAFIDYSPINENFCSIRLGGISLWQHVNPYLTFSGDTLFYSGTGTADYYSEGSIICYLNRVRDIMGNESTYAGGDFPAWHFTVDKSPPVAVSPLPADGSATSDASPVLSVEISDVISGVLADSILFNIDGTDYRLATTPALTWDSTRATFNTATAGLSWGDSDTVEVCVTAIDRVHPDKCGPNRMNPPFCWSFIVDNSGPTAEIIDPPDGEWTACEFQQIKVRLTDAAGVETSTIQLSVGGSVYTFPDHLTYADDTLIFTPTAPFTDGATVNVSLISAEDGFGNGLSGSVSSVFYVDLSAPYTTMISPPPGSIIGPTDVVEASILDAGIGVDGTSFEVTMRGTPYSWPSFMIWDGANFSFNPFATGEVFSDGDTIQFCLGADDLIMPSYCGPNEMDTCWFNVFDQSGPIANFLYPGDSIITACSGDEIRIHLLDAAGIDWPTVQLIVDGAMYSWPNPRLSNDGDTLVFTPATPFSHADTIVVVLNSADDLVGNTLVDAPLSWIFVIDTQPPQITGHIPGHGDVISNPAPNIRVAIADVPAGVDPTLFSINIEGTPYSWPNPALTWDGTYLAFNSATAGLSFADGDSVHVCMLDAGDNVSAMFCGPNTVDFDSCWAFEVNLSGPVADLLHPLDHSFSACPLQTVIFSITDDQGVLPESCTVEIDGVVYDFPDHLTWANDSLTFIPTTPFTHGDTIQVAVLNASDSLGNALSGTFEWWFLSDQAPPVLLDIIPAPGSILSEASPLIQILTIDSLSGENPTKFHIRLDGTPYVGMLPWIWWLDPGFSLQTGMGGFSWADGETIDVCVDSMSDIVSELYCGPNTAYPDTCWEYYIDLSGPEVELVYPDSGIITACADSSVTIRLYDNTGVNPDSIRFWINGSTFNLTSPRLSYANDTLRYTPPTPFTHGDTIDFRVSRAVDMAGNALADAPTWRFIVDIQPPNLVSINPLPGSMMTDPEPILEFGFSDSPAGVDSSAIELDLNGTVYTLADVGVTWNSGTGVLTFDASTAGASFGPGNLDVCVSSADKVLPAWCGPNISADSCFIYPYDLIGPTATPIDPSPGEITACDLVSIQIRLTDDRGVQPDSIELTVDGTAYRLADPELSYLGDSLVVFVPPAPYTEGTINVSLRAFDISGNSLESGPLSYSFQVDLSPPVLSGETPAPGGVISTTTPIIEFDLTDVPAGVDEASIILDVAGEVIRTTDTGASWAGGHFAFDTDAGGVELNDGDSVICCVSASDDPDSCGPNAMDPECWVFHINIDGPSAGIISPRDGRISSCDDQQISLWVTDGNGVDESTILLTVNGTTYVTAGPELDYDGDSVLTFTPLTPWAHNDTVRVQLSAADDIHGLPLDSPLLWEFIIDLEPPVVESFEPPSGTGFNVSDTLIEIVISDFPAGVNRSSLSMRIGGVIYSWPTAGLSWIGDTLSFRLSDIGFTPIDGETLDICVEIIADAPDICPPNELETPECAIYVFDFRGPRASLISPPESSWVSCESQPIEIYLADASGIDMTTIELEIDGAVYSWPDPALTYISPVLTFTPSSPWPEGVEINVALNSANDLSGNTLEDAPLEFVFGVDTSPPEVVATNPASGEVVDTTMAVISAEIIDASAGVFSGGMSISVDGLPFAFSHPAVSWDGSNLSLDVSTAGIVLEEGAPIEVCVDSVVDMAILCGPNSMPRYCWEFVADGGPPSMDMLWPPEDVVVSCPEESIVVVFSDPGGILFDSLRISVAGVEYSWSSPQIVIADDSTIVFTPTTPFSHGSMVIVQVLEIADNYGNTAGAGPVWSFQMDLRPPEADMFHPAPMAIAGSDSISLRLIDVPAGVDPSSIVLSVTGAGSYTLASPALYFEDPILAFDPSLAGVSFGDGDTAEICISASDDPDICDPNMLEDSCWSFIVDAGGPEASLVLPSPGIVTSCADHGAVFTITDPSGIDETTISIRINTAVLDISEPSISWSAPSLLYEPLAPWSHGDTVRVSVIGAEDMTGNAMVASDSVGTYYIIDIEPPMISLPFPPDGAIVADPAQPVWVRIEDSPAGVDTSSVRISVDGSIFLVSHPAVHWEGRELHFDPATAGLAFEDGDTVEICLMDVFDTPDTCPPNIVGSPYCWEFYINLAGPTARIGHPRSNRWVACPPADQDLTVIITDADGIVEDSIHLRVNGDDYYIGSPELDYTDTILTYTPSVGWSDGDTVVVSLVYVEDSLGNGLGAPLNWSFFVDLSSPYPGIPMPSDGTVTGIMPNVSIPIYDDGSGVDPSSIVLSLNGEEYSLGAGLVWASSNATIFSDSLITAPSGTIEVCLDSVSDSPDYCEPNALGTPFCWEFALDVSNPEAHVISPGDGDWVACDSGEQTIEIYLFDDNGIVADSIRMRVAGVTYTYTSGPMAYADSILTFVPTSPWEDGDTIVVQLLRAPDSLGNPLEPLIYEFYVDQTPPNIYDFAPPDGGGSPGLSPIISAKIHDTGSGLDTSSIVATINGVDFPILTTPGLTWNEGDTTASIDCDVASISFMLGDTIDFCFSATDSPDLCDPNLTEECWSFIADEGGPLVALISPDSNSCSACSSQGFTVRISDVIGVDVSSIKFRVNEVPYTVDSAGVIYDGMFGRLDYTPTEPWEDGDIIHVDSLAAMDIHGNWSDGFLEFRIYIDLSPPIVFGFDPPIAGYSSSSSPEISFIIADSGCGVNPSSIRFTVEGDLFTLDSTGVGYGGDTVTFDCAAHGMVFDDGDTVNICVTNAVDMAELCTPNALPDSVCWFFMVSSSGPVVAPVTPLPGQWVSCDSGEQIVSILIEDPDGIDETTIEFIIDSVSYSTGALELSYDHATGILDYRPSTPWEDGDTFEVILYSAGDSMGHGLAAPLTYYFYTDFVPPETTFVLPEVGIALRPSPIWVMAGVVDIGAGLDETTLGISINGVWHNYGDPGVSWFDDTLVYDGAITGDSLFAADTLEVCLRGADAIDVCDSNWMNTCWEYIATSNGPVATPVFPLNGTAVSCLDSLVVMHLADTDSHRINYTSFLVEVNGVISSGWPTIHLYDDAESLLYINPGTMSPPAPDSIFDHGDTICVTLLECEDIYHTPLAAPLNVCFYLDSIGPEIIDAFPPIGGSIMPGAPNMWFLAEDFPAGIHHYIGQIQIGPYTYEVPGDISFAGDTLKLPSAVYSSDTSFFDGDTVCLTITLYDSAQYCGENISVTEWCFTVGVSPPVLTNFSPPDSAITSCTDGNMMVILDDDDGFNYNQTGINVDGTDYIAAFDIEITVRADTMFFNTETPFTHGETVVWYPFARDIHGTPAEFADTFVFIVDAEPPVAESYIPAIDAESFDWEAGIGLILSDSLAGLADFVTLTVTTPRWTRVFAPDSTAFGWIDGVLSFDVPAYNGGTPWAPALDDELIFWHERETVLVEVYTGDLACCCESNDSIYSWSFIILDDDTVGPEIVNIEPTEVYSGFGADVRADVTDPSGVFDDNTSAQGMYLIWDTDGSLSDGGENLAQMSLESGDTYISETPIGPFNIGDVPVFCIVAHDDDYDFEDTLDRAVTVSDTIYPLLIEGSGPRAALIFPTDSTWISCDSGPIVISLEDAQGVDETTILAEVFGQELTVCGGLEFFADTLYWWPETLLANGADFDFRLLSAEDNLGYSMDSIYIWNFRIDTEAPSISLLNPEDISHLTQPIINWEISDNAAGVDDTLLIIHADGYEFRSSDASVTWNGSILTFDAGIAGFDLQWRDLLVCIEACDLAHSCGPNCADTLCAVMSIAKDTPCDVWPIPFTPNDDGANDVVWFEYPNMFYDGADVEIFDLEGRRIFTAQFPPTRPEAQAFWSGVRTDSKLAIPGTYIYVITRDNEVLCKGSLVLVR